VSSRGHKVTIKTNTPGNGQGCNVADEMGCRCRRTMTAFPNGICCGRCWRALGWVGPCSGPVGYLCSWGRGGRVVRVPEEPNWKPRASYLMSQIRDRAPYI